MNPLSKCNHKPVVIWDVNRLVPESASTSSSSENSFSQVLNQGFSNVHKYHRGGFYKADSLAPTSRDQSVGSGA